MLNLFFSGSRQEFWEIREPISFPRKNHVTICRSSHSVEKHSTMWNLRNLISSLHFECFQHNYPLGSWHFHTFNHIYKKNFFVSTLTLRLATHEKHEWWNTCFNCLYQRAQSSWHSLENNKKIKENIQGLIVLMTLWWRVSLKVVTSRTK